MVFAAKGLLILRLIEEEEQKGRASAAGRR